MSFLPSILMAERLYIHGTANNLPQDVEDMQLLELAPADLELGFFDHHVPKVVSPWLSFTCSCDAMPVMASFVLAAARGWNGTSFIS
jgi:hypothetical protein